MAYTDKGKIKARQNRLAEQRLRRQQEEEQRRKEEEERKCRQEEARRRQEEAARRKERQERQRQERERKQKEAAKKVSGESIKATQFLMNRFGFTDKQGNPLKEDGIFGDKTKQAAEKFQRYQKELDQPSQKTKTLQEGLNQSGRTYLDGNPLKVDGVYGPKTDHMKSVVDNDFTGWLDSDRYKEKTIGTKIFPRMPKLENKAVNDIAEGRWSKLWDNQEDAARTMEYRIPIDEKEKKEINLPGSYIGTEREEKDVRELQDLFKNAINEQKQSWNGKDMVYNKETNRKNANIELLGSQVEARPTQPPKEETDKSGNLWSENWNAAPQYGNGEKWTVQKPDMYSVNNGGLKLSGSASTEKDGKTNSAKSKAYDQAPDELKRVYDVLGEGDTSSGISFEGIQKSFGHEMEFSMDNEGNVVGDYRKAFENKISQQYPDLNQKEKEDLVEGTMLLLKTEFAKKQAEPEKVIDVTQRYGTMVEQSMNNPFWQTEMLGFAGQKGAYYLKNSPEKIDELTQGRIPRDVMDEAKRIGGEDGVNHLLQEGYGYFRVGDKVMNPEELGNYSLGLIASAHKVSRGMGYFAGDADKVWQRGSDAGEIYDKYYQTMGMNDFGTIW